MAKKINVLFPSYCCIRSDAAALIYNQYCPIEKGNDSISIQCHVFLPQCLSARLEAPS